MVTTVSQEEEEIFSADWLSGRSDGSIELSALTRRWRPQKNDILTAMSHASISMNVEWKDGVDEAVLLNCHDLSGRREESRHHGEEENVSQCSYVQQ